MAAASTLEAGFAGLANDGDSLSVCRGFASDGDSLSVFRGCVLGSRGPRNPARRRAEGLSDGACGCSPGPADAPSSLAAAGCVASADRTLAMGRGVVEGV